MGVDRLDGDRQDPRRHTVVSEGEPPDAGGGAPALYTVGSAWVSGEEGRKGVIAPGRLADLAVLSADYFTVPEADIRGIEAVLTVVGGKMVYGADDFEKLAAAPPPVSPDWSPVKTYGGYYRRKQTAP